MVNVGLGKYTIHGSYEDDLSFPEVNFSNAPMSFNQVDHIPHLSDTFSSHPNPEQTGWFLLHIFHYLRVKNEKKRIPRRQDI